MPFASFVPNATHTRSQSKASAFRFPCDYKLAKIFAKADLKGVSDDFYSKCFSALTGNNVQNVEKILNNIHSTNPILFTSKILPKANIKKIDGVKVIDIVNGDDNLTFRQHGY